MEENGILLDFLKDLDQANKKKLKIRRTNLSISRSEFNINSPQQLSVILFEN